MIFVENTPDICSDADDNDGHDEAMQICRLSVAFTRVEPGVPATIKLKIGQQPQNQAHVVPPGVTLAIVRNGDTPVHLVRNGAEPALSVKEGSLVFVDRIGAMSMPVGLTTQLIACDGASLWLERVTGGSFCRGGRGARQAGRPAQGPGAVVDR